MTSPVRAWAIGGSRDDVIDGSPEHAHTPKYAASHSVMRCFSPHCGAPVSDVALFCDLHLWTFDNPILRDAEIFLSVSPMLLERSARYPNNKAAVP